MQLMPNDTEQHTSDTRGQTASSSNLPAPSQRRGRGAIAALLCLGSCLVILTYSRLPPGICFDDSGDLQVAAATLGIAHPPGYALYSSFGHLLTRIPGVEPARAITLGCLASGIGALLLCAGVQIRLGVHPWLAVTACLALALHPRVWINLIVPEVYAPTWLFVTAALYFLSVYFTGADRRMMWLYAAFIYLGIATASRPPILLILPGILLGLLIFRSERNRAFTARLRTAVLCFVCFTAPMGYSIGYFWFRDTSNQPHNYIEDYSRSHRLLPAADAGAPAKARRIWWLTSGEQYRAEHVSPGNTLVRLRWIGEQAASGSDLVFLAATAALAVGTTAVRRRSMPALVMLVGVLLGAIFFLCIYVVFDTAADLLPLLGAVCIFGGAGLNSFLGHVKEPWQGVIALSIFTVLIIFAVRHARGLPDNTAQYDATAFVRSANLSHLPPNSLVLTSWRKHAPLNYARLVEARRHDISIVFTTPERWAELVTACIARGETAYASDPIPPPPGTILTPAGSLWRLEFQESIPEGG